MISDRGDHIRGPTPKPITMIEHVRMATSSDTSYWSWIRPSPPVTMDDPNAMHTTSIETTSVMYHRYQGDQLCGFSGSPMVKVTNSTPPALPLPSWSSSSSSSHGGGGGACDSDSFSTSRSGWLDLAVAAEARDRICSRVRCGTSPVAVSMVYSSGNMGC